MTAQHQRSPLRSGSPAILQTRTVSTTTRTIETGNQTRLGSPTLRLRGAHTTSQRTVQWANDVVDNEGLGRKKSKGMFLLPRLPASSAESLLDAGLYDCLNRLFDTPRLTFMFFSPVCCIYHRPKGIDESSDESSSESSSSDESDSDYEGGRRRIPSGDNEGKGHRCNGHRHDHGGRGRKDCDDGKKKRKEKRRPSPNAYERMPKYKPRSAEPGQGGNAGA